MIDSAYVLAGAFTGFVVGLTGVGGGALMTPILLIFFGVSPIAAIATDLWFAAITKLVGARVHHAHNQVDWSVVRRLWIGSLPVAVVSVLLVNLSIQVGKVDWLGRIIGLVILISAIGMLASHKLVAYARELRIGWPEKFKGVQPVLTVFAGGVMGLCIALTSVGAGALGSVFLLYLYPLRMNPHRLIATDIVHAIPLAAVSGLGYLFYGTVDWSMLMSLLIGSIPAVLLGSKLAIVINGRWLQVLLSLVLMAASIKLLL